LGGLERAGDFFGQDLQDFGINGIFFGVRWKVERGALGGRGRSGDTRSDDGYFAGSLWLGLLLRSVRGAMVGTFWELWGAVG
jgi:hypothetical protein